MFWPPRLLYCLYHMLFYSALAIQSKYYRVISVCITVLSVGGHGGSITLRLSENWMRNVWSVISVSMLWTAWWLLKCTILWKKITWQRHCFIQNLPGNKLLSLSASKNVLMCIYILLEHDFEEERWRCSLSSCVCICKPERKTGCDRDLWKFRRQQRGEGWNAGSGLNVLNAHPNTRGHGEWGVTVVGSVQRWSNSPLGAALWDWARLCAGPFEPTPCKGQQNKMKNHNMVNKACVHHSKCACI